MNEQLKIIISAEIAKFKKATDDAEKEVLSFKQQVEKAGENIDETFAEAGTSIGNGMKAGIGIATKAMAGLTAAFALVTKGTEEYRNNQAKLITAFETAGGSAEAAKDTYNDLYRVLGDGGQATEAAQHLAKLTNEEKALADYTNICKGVYAQFGASLPIESLTEAINHTAKVGEVQGSLADALEWSGVNMDEFNEQLFWCNSESEREKLIRDTLNGIYSESAAAYEENNAEILAQRDAQAQLQESLAAMGEALAPLMVMLTDLGVTVLAALAPYVQEFAQKHLPTIKDVLGGVVGFLADAIKWMNEHKTILGVIAGVIATVVAAIGLYNAVAAIKAAMDAAQVTTIGALIAAHAAQAVAAMAALAPYLLIAAAIAAVIAIIVLCVKHWDDIAAAGKKAGEWIKNAWSSIGNWFKEKVITPIVNTFTNLWSKAKEVIDKIKGLFKFEWSLPKLKVPKFSITPSGWGVGDLLKGVIPKLGVTWNARGGVFDKPTIMGYGNSLQGLGENGAEAVVPLENNLEWLNKLADMLGERMGANTPVVLQVDGKTFAKTAISTINSLTKQQGKLGLVIQ